MKTLAISLSTQQKPFEFLMKLCKLALAGGAAFWVTTLATSLLPIAAKYRAAFSDWSIQTVWFSSLIAGLIIGCFVSYFLLRFFPRIPANGPILKSVVLSSIALVIAIILIDVPMLLHAPGNALYFFLIGVAFNAARFLLLGIAVGFYIEGCKVYSELTKRQGPVNC